MKKVYILLTMAVAVFASCQNDNEELTPEKKGVKLTISTSIAKPATTRTSYVYHEGETGKSGTISVSWEEEENITVVSIGEAGITAVDNFTSTGAAGRDKAEFTGTWTGNAGDKVICLYPAISVGRFTGVTVGSTSIEVDCAAHNLANSLEENVIKNYDIMVGDVSISGTTASVQLQRKITVLRVGLYQNWYYSPQAQNFWKLGISASNSEDEPKCFVAKGAIAATKSTYTGDITPVTYQGPNWNNFNTPGARWGYRYHFIPVIANGSLVEGDKLKIHWAYTDKYSVDPLWYSDDLTATKDITSTLTFQPGCVYTLEAKLL